MVPARDLATTYGVSPEEIGQVIRGQFRAYRATLQLDRRRLLEHHEIVDLARKVVGVGSVGTGAYIVLLQGRDADDPRRAGDENRTRIIRLGICAVRACHMA